MFNLIKFKKVYAFFPYSRIFCVMGGTLMSVLGKYGIIYIDT